jgi:hypothetical protein
MWETILPLLIRYIVIPEVARLLRGNPQITDAEILTQLPADVRALVTSNQAFLDSIRAQAGR